MIIHFRCLDLSVTLGHNMHFFIFFIQETAFEQMRFSVKAAIFKFI